MNYREQFAILIGALGSATPMMVGLFWLARYDQSGPFFYGLSYTLFSLCLTVPLMALAHSRCTP